MSRRKAFDSLRILAECMCSVRPCMAQQPASLMSLALRTSPAGGASPASSSTIVWGSTSVIPHRLRSASSQTGHRELSDDDYHKHSDRTMDLLWDACDAYVEDADIKDADVQYSQGVLTVKLGDSGTYVVNKQVPNRQIWMSSPVSGPVRYDWEDGRWVYRRDGHDMFERLQHEFRQLFDTPLQIDDDEH